MASLLNYRLQNRKTRPNQSTNNRVMAEIAIRYVVRDLVSDTLVRERLSFLKVTYTFIK